MRLVYEGPFKGFESHPVHEKSEGPVQSLGPRKKWHHLSVEYRGPERVDLNRLNRWT